MSLLDLVPPQSVYALLVLVIWGVYARRRRKQHRHSLSALRASREAGLSEPASLHPVIDPSRCLGCGTCVAACPERDVLGLIDGKSTLINPANCIGHGACWEECPFDAITLVLGTDRRGVEIPVLGPDFQTNVPGLFVAGELGGMGLIRNAIEQGRQAIESLRALDGIGRGAGLDVVIVGAGPAGFSASLAAMQNGLRYATLEQEVLGGTVAHYPRGKIVMTAPAVLPMIGKVKLRETTKEGLLDFWKEVEKKTGVQINYRERVVAIRPAEEGFEVESTRGSYRTRAVVLAIGRRGTPRKLGVPGEELPKVVYQLVEPEQYRGQSVLVVGGGDSALEAASSLAELDGTAVALSYRGSAFSRAKPANRERLEAARTSGRLRVLLESNVTEIHPTHVRLSTPGGRQEIENLAVIVSAGGVLPSAFLGACGVQMETKHGTPCG